MPTGQNLPYSVDCVRMIPELLSMSLIYLRENGS